MVKDVIKRLNWFRYRRVLDRMATMDQFISLMDRVQDPIFKQYEQWDHIQAYNQELNSVLKILRVNVRGKSFLDIGPGLGSTLDAAKKLGASCVEFVEYNPYFYTFNRLKNFTGYQMDARKDLSTLPLQYDFIWIKQTFVADRFIVQKRNPLLRVLFRYPNLDVLLDQIESLAAAEGLIIFCPHWSLPKAKRMEVQETFLSCMAEHGYYTLPQVKCHNIEPVSSITFYKKVPK